jgi:hypothetical protein
MQAIPKLALLMVLLAASMYIDTMRPTKQRGLRGGLNCGLSWTCESYSTGIGATVLTSTAFTREL